MPERSEGEFLARCERCRESSNTGAQGSPLALARPIDHTARTGAERTGNWGPVQSHSRGPSHTLDCHSIWVSLWSSFRGTRRTDRVAPWMSVAISVPCKHRGSGKMRLRVQTRAPIRRDVPIHRAPRSIGRPLGGVSQATAATDLGAGVGATGKRPIGAVVRRLLRICC